MNPAVKYIQDQIEELEKLEPCDFVKGQIYALMGVLAEINRTK